eukprot:scaffold1418_cov352-Prasinococcus_capsulatus_cf.AAC.4
MAGAPGGPQPPVFLGRVSWRAGPPKWPPLLRWAPALHQPASGWLRVPRDARTFAVQRSSAIPARSTCRLVGGGPTRCQVLLAGCTTYVVLRGQAAPPPPSPSPWRVTRVAACPPGVQGGSHAPWPPWPYAPPHRSPARLTPCPRHSILDGRGPPPLVGTGWMQRPGPFLPL